MSAKRDRTVLLVGVLLLLAARTAPGQTFRSTFRDWRVFPTEPVLSTSGTYSYPVKGAYDSSGSLSMVFPEAFNTRAPDGYHQIFETPQTFTATASYTHKAPPVFPPEQPKSYSVSSTIYMRDDWGYQTDPNLCLQKGPVQQVSSGQSVSFNVSVACNLTQFLYGNNSVPDGITTNYSGLQVWFSVEVDGAKSLDVRLFGVYKNVSTTDSLFIATGKLVPSPFQRLTPGTQQGFSAEVNVQLLSRDRAELDFRIYDQQGILQGSMPQNIQLTKGPYRSGVPVAIPPFTIDTGTTRLDLKAVLVDGTNVFKESNVIEYTVGDDCVLTGRLFRNGRLGVYALPDATVELWDVTSSPAVLVDKVKAQLKGTFQSPDSSYCFKLPAGFDYGKSYQLRVRLRDAIEPAAARFLISGTPGNPAAEELRWGSFRLTAGQTTRRDLEVAMEAGLQVDAVPRDTLYAAAEIYWHVWRAVNIMMAVNTNVTLSRDLPLEVYLNSGGTSHYCYFPSDCGTRTSILLETVDSVPGANPSTVWHEFGHHLIRELYGDELPRPPDAQYDANHDGYANDYTTASIDEGFATFWAVHSSRVLEPTRKVGYRWNIPTPQTTTTQDIDVNSLATSEAIGPWAHIEEEKAVAGLLWDLTDSRSDPLIGAGSMAAGDSVTKSLSEVLGVLASAKAGTMFGVYRALKTAFPDLASAAPGALSPLDQLFVLHGFYADNKVADWRYTDGEEIGRAANGLTWTGRAYDTQGQPRTVLPRPRRENFPQVTGSLLDVKLVDESGKPVPESALSLKVEYDPPYESLNGDVETLTLGDGRVYLSMPPPNYPARLVVGVPGSQQTPLVIDNGSYWRTVGTAPVVASQTFVVPSAPVAEVAPAGLDFGSVAAGSSADRSLVVRNAGSGTLVVSAVAAGSRRYRNVTPLPLSIPAGTSQSLTLRFTPASPGAQNSTLYVVTSDPKKRTSLVPLTGSGTPPDAPEVSATPDAYDFGGVAVSQAQTVSITLSNTGTRALSVSAATPIGPFALVSPSAPFSVAAGGQQALTVRFTPSSAGAHAGSLTLATNDADEAAFVLDLRGEGVSGGGSGGTEVLATDDGTPETGAYANGLAIVNRFTPSGYPRRLTAIRLYHVQFQNLPSPALATVRLIAFADPAGSGTSPQVPSTLLVNQTATLPSLPIGGGFVDLPISNGPVIASGDLYAGYVAPNPAGGVVFAADSSGAQRQRGYFSTDGGLSFLGPLVLESQSGAQTQVNIMVRAVTEVVSAPTGGCTFAVTRGAPSLGAAASTAAVGVVAPAGCAWTATSDAPWITLSASGGSGSGSVTLQAAANPSAQARTGSVRVAGFSVTVSQAGSEGQEEARTLVPILLATAGAANAYFTSELTLTNRGTTDVVAELDYSAALGSGSGGGLDVIPARSQVTFPDAISYLRSTGVPLPDSGNRGGTVRLRLLGASSREAVSATVRTTSLVPEGRAGLAYADVPSAGALAGPAVLCGLRQNEQDRSNVAVLNAGTAADGDVTLRLTVVSGDPAAPIRATLPDVSLPPGGFTQISGILASGGLSLANGFVRVERVGGTAPYYAYAVINDQKNSDGSFVPPVLESALAGRAGLTVPVIVETSGFSSELVATNFGAATKTLRLTYVADAVSAAGNAATFTLTLRPSEQLVIPGLVAYLRQQGAPGVGSGTFAGALFASVDGGDVSGLFLGARTSSPGGGGRYGLFYAGVPYGRAASRSAWVFGLQQTAESRSNLALVNTGETDGSTDVFRLEIYDGATGALVRTLDGEAVGPRRFKQLNTLLKTYAPGTTNGYVKVTRTEGTNPFIAYGVVNDGGEPGQRTGDGAFVPMSSVDE